MLLRETRLQWRVAQGFPSGQRGRAVNPLAQPSEVRILSPAYEGGGNHVSPAGPLLRGCAWSTGCWPPGRRSRPPAADPSAHGSAYAVRCPASARHLMGTTPSSVAGGSASPRRCSRRRVLEAASPASNARDAAGDPHHILLAQVDDVVVELHPAAPGHDEVDLLGPVVAVPKPCRLPGLAGGS